MEPTLETALLHAREATAAAAVAIRAAHTAASHENPFAAALLLDRTREAADLHNGVSYLYAIAAEGGAK